MSRPAGESQSLAGWRQQTFALILSNSTCCVKWSEAVEHMGELGVPMRLVSGALLVRGSNSLYGAARNWRGTEGSSEPLELGQTVRRELKARA
jgi:hypothetical protein